MPTSRYFSRMSNDEKPPERYAKIYLYEWMVAKGFTEQKMLAAKMMRSEGAISKKFQKPWRIDAQWLQEFADALGTAPANLFYHPSAFGERPAQPRQSLGVLMEIAEQATDQQIAHLIGVLSPSFSPPAEPVPAVQEMPGPKGS